MTIVTNDNIFGPPILLVDPTPGKGTHTTIGGAFADVSTGESVCIRPGTYTEDLIFPAGINVWSGGISGSENVEIIGSHTFSANGTSTFFGLRFSSNGSDIITFSGANTTQTSFINCQFFLNDGDGININNSNANPLFRSCSFQITADNLDFFNSTNLGNLTFEFCKLFVSTSVTSFGTSTFANGNLIMRNCYIQQQSFTCSSTGTFRIQDCSFNINNNNLTPITTAGTSSSHFILNSILASGTSAALSIGSGTTVLVDNLKVRSTNANPLTGAGTLNYGAVVFYDTGNGINVSTTNARSIRTGTLNLVNPLTVANGGTGVATLTGIPAGNGTSAFTARTITGTSDQITVSNGNGVSGNPTISLVTGTFTPTISTSGGGDTKTYLGQEGWHVKLGSIVLFYARVTWEAFSGGSGEARVNVPFAADAFRAMGTAESSDFTSTTTPRLLQTITSSTSVKLLLTNSADDRDAIATLLTAAQIPAAGTIRYWGHYII